MRTLRGPVDALEFGADALTGGSRGWFVRTVLVVVWVAVMLVSSVGVVYCVQEIPAAVAADRGEGAEGWFTPETLECSVVPTDEETCHWVGDFLSDDQKVYLDDVKVLDESTVERAESPIRALDTGMADKVHPVGEDNVVGVIVLIFFLVAFPVVLFYTSWFAIRWLRGAQPEH